MNTIRELKQQEKYKSMLKRKNKEKKIYKDKNASLQIEKQRLYIALRNKDKIIDDLQDRIDKAIEYIELWHYRNDYRVNSFTTECKNDLLEILKGSDKE